MPNTDQWLPGDERGMRATLKMRTRKIWGKGRAIITLMVVMGSWYIHMTGLIRLYNLLFLKMNL